MNIEMQYLKVGHYIRRKEQFKRKGLLSKLFPTGTKWVWYRVERVVVPYDLVPMSLVLTNCKTGEQREELVNPWAKVTAYYKPNIKS